MDRRDLQTSAEQQFQREQAKIEYKRQQRQQLADYREKMYYGSRTDKREIWNKMNKELESQRIVRHFTKL